MASVYGYTLDEHEYRAEVPRMYVNMPSEPTIVIAISAHGGGTVGESYAGNGWDYSVYVDGTEVISDGDIRSAEGTPAGHHEMIRVLCGFLSAYGESLLHRGDDSEYADEYPNGPARDLLVSEYERLSLVSGDEPLEELIPLP